MSFSWEDFKTLAEELCIKSDEASQRTAISRFYYASFGYSRQHLTEFLDKDDFNKDNEIHKRVHEYFLNEHRMEEHSHIASNLKRLRANRNKSDYRLNFPNIKSYIEKSKKNSDNIFKDVNKLKKMNIKF